METDFDGAESDEDVADERFSRKSLRVAARVLIAEDDEEMRRLLRDAFAFDGYQVVDVGNGLDLFDTLRRCREAGVEPAVVISDLRMPGLNGLEVLYRIREWGCTIPVVLITAFGDDETHDAAVELGATAFFSKPFDIDDLRTAVAYFLSENASEKTGRRAAP